MILAGNAHQAEHRQQLQLALGKLIEANVACGVFVLEVDTNFFDQVPYVSGFGITEEAVSLPHQRAQLFQFFFIGKKEVKLFLTLSATSKINQLTGGLFD